MCSRALFLNLCSLMFCRVSHFPGVVSDSPGMLTLKPNFVKSLRYACIRSFFLKLVSKQVTEVILVILVRLFTVCSQVELLSPRRKIL